MAHRTLNPVTKFWGDMRETATHKRTADKKYNGAKDAWADEFPTIDWPIYPGSAFDNYEKLEAAGWVFSSRYGWRKAPTPEAS